jgi:hypothetical protein
MRLDLWRCDPASKPAASDVASVGVPAAMTAQPANRPQAVFAGAGAGGGTRAGQRRQEPHAWGVAYPQGRAGG